MNSSRVAVVAMLVAAEIFLLGLMLSSLHGGSIFAASGFHRVDADTKTYPALAAGLSPDVEIDDRDSRVTVSASSDGLVHVSDARNIHGFVWGSSSRPDLQIARRASGVRIARPGNADRLTAIFGEDFQRTEVAVPAGAHVRITGCAGAEVRDVRNGAEIESQDGRITLTGVQGAIVAHSDDGSIHLNDVSSNALDVKTSDGRIEATNLAVEGNAPHATLHTDDGSVHLIGRFAAAGSYDVSTNDGRVELTLPSDADLTVNASTGDGHIYVDGSRFGEGDAATHTIRLGNGSGALRLATQDGSIHIMTNGAT